MRSAPINLLRLAAIGAISAASFFASATPAAAYVNSDNVIIDLHVQGCNNNGICEPLNNEDINNCPIDCTPPPPPPATTTPSGGGGGGGGISTYNPIDNSTLTISTTESSAEIDWRTSAPVISTLKWGTTSDYDGGTLSETSFAYAHSELISNLLPNTTYYFSIDSRSTTGAPFTSYHGIFTTQKPAAAQIGSYPANVGGFSAKSQSGGVALTWSNPSDPNFDQVRIVRSPSFYPADPLNGYIVYEGSGNSYFDAGANPANAYYYAIFVRDTVGAYSTGSLAKSSPVASATNPSNPSNPSNPGQPTTPSQPAAPGNPSNPSNPAQPGNPALPPPFSAPVSFVQHGSLLPQNQNSGAYVGDQSGPITLKVGISDDNRADIHIGLLFLTDSAGKSYGYLLRQAEKGGYEAVVSSLPHSGAYSYTVSLYQSVPLKRFDLSGKIIISAQGSSSASGGNSSDSSRTLWIWIGIAALLVFILYLL